ncbi:hypothetical protein F5B19DRAFT_474148 [Rostrohypoxylon terebratum]|nr:hypothetical protein F5B19DRAFT_474148 [Rostrohypoxylon terebratum]
MSKTVKISFIILLFSVILYYCSMFNFWPFSREELPPPVDRSDVNPPDRINVCPDDDPWPPTKRRASIGIPYTQVYGYPSTGGALVLPYCNGVDLDFLGLSRFKSCDKSEDQKAEDRHCALMRKLGAWSIRNVDDYLLDEMTRRSQSISQTLVFAAWPKNGEGVWVLSMGEYEAAEKGVGAFFNAFSMDERCEILEKLGAEFYQDPADCPHLDLR